MSEDFDVTDTSAAIKPLISSISQLFHTNKYSDLVITCEVNDQSWRAHKVIVGAHSDALEATLHRGAQLEEKKEKNEIKLDDDPQAIEAMLSYMYKLDYGDYSNSQEHVAAIVLDAKVFVVADKYFIKPLMHLAARKFEARCKSEWTTPSFADAVKEVYTTAPDHDDRLKRIVIDVVKEHVTELFQHRPLKYQPFNKMIREVADLGADVSQELALSMPKFVTYKCPNDGEIFHLSVPTPTLFTCSNGCNSLAQNADWWAKYVQK